MSKESFKISKSILLKPRTLITSPEDGEIQYDLSSAKFKFRENGSWITLGTTATATDTSFSINDATDATKQIKFDAAGSTSTSTTIQSSQTSNRVVTIPDATGNFVLDTNSQTLQNKSIDATNNTISNLTNTNISSSANIARSKLASGSNNALQANNGSGVLTDITDITIGTNSLTLANTKHLELTATSDATTSGTNATLTSFTGPAIRLTNGSLVSLANIPEGTEGQDLTIFNRIGSAINIPDSSSAIGTAARRIFTGTNATLSMPNNSALKFRYDTASARWQVIGGSGGATGSSLIILDEGTQLTTAASSINFVGASVTATNSGNDVTVTINAGAATSVPWSGITSIPSPVSSLSGTNTGDVTLSSFGSSPSANGASLSGQALTIQPADATHPGSVSTTTQTFGGMKTFASGVTVGGSSSTSNNIFSLNQGYPLSFLVTDNASNTVEGVRINQYGFVTIGGSADATSFLENKGSLALPITTKTANFNADINTYTIMVDATSGVKTITLPAASSCSGRVYNIKKVDSGANAVTIATTSSQTIDGSTTKTLSNQYDSYELQSNGSNWYITAQVGGSTSFSGTLGIANGGTNATSFSSPASGINPIVFYDGTRFVTDATVAHLGYNTSTDTFYSGAINISGAVTQVAKFTNTATQSSTAGAGMSGFSDSGAAMTSGNRLGFYTLGGATDASHTTNNSVAMSAFATENWSGTASGSKLQFEVTPNTTVNRIAALTIDQNGNVGIGTSQTSPANPLSVAGIIQSTTGGFKFPDGTIQSTAALNDPNILMEDQADNSSLTDYTQTNLELVTSPILHGTKSFRLQHSTSIKSFKKVIAVDKKFRGYNLTAKLDVLSSATSGNLNILFYDETNSANLVASQSIATNSQAITATTANASASLTGLDTATFNKLKVGMLITGSAIPVGTTITALNTSTLVATMSASATGVSTGIRISDLVARKTFSFDVPNNCSSLSWTISSVVEANTESYIDDIVIALTSTALTSTSVTLPVNNNYDWTSYTPTITGFGTPTNVSFFHKRIGGDIEVEGTFTAGTVSATLVSFSLPSGAVIDTTKISIQNTTSAAGQAIGMVSQNSGANSGFALTATGTSTSLVYAGQNTATTNTLTPQNGSVYTSSQVTSVRFKLPVANWLENTTSSTTIPLTSAQLVQTPDSYLRLNTQNGYGSTNTKIRRFLTLVTNIGSDITYQDSTTLGASFTIQTAGVYNIVYSDEQTSGVVGLSLNTTQPTVGISTIETSGTEVLAWSVANTENNVAWTGYLNVGDVIRPHTDGGSGGTTTRCHFHITKQGSLKQLNPSSDSKITIPTHQLRFEGAAALGTTDTGIVKFDTQTITQGDAWTVTNTTPNGTVVTMKKGGMLSARSSIYQSANTTVFSQITKNQSVLTTTSSVGSEVMSSFRQSSTGFMLSNSAVFPVNVGDIIRVAASSAPNQDTSNNSFSLVLTETSIPANFSNVLPQWSQSDSSVRLNTLLSGTSGYGSTNTAIYRFANTIDNIGSDITYTDSATEGAKFTINSDGLYSIAWSGVTDTTSTMGISKNSTQLSTDIANINASDRLAHASMAAVGADVNPSVQVYLLKGDIIRPHGTPSVQTTVRNARNEFTISKVGKPNLTSVDVTPFVNMKTTDTENIIFSNQAKSSANLTTTSKNTNVGILSLNSTTGVMTALKRCLINVNVTVINATTTNRVTPQVLINSVVKSIDTNDTANNNTGASASYSELVEAGTTIELFIGGAADLAMGAITATADNNATAAPMQQVSSDTMSFVFKSTAITTSDPVGTFNTYTYAANTNTATIATSAPTQTTSSMNTNGIQVFARAYNTASTTASPARVDIFIGTGLSSTQVNGYISSSKTTSFSMDRIFNGSTSDFGTECQYNSSTGVLSIIAGMNISSAVTTRYIDTQGNAISGYFVFNASKSPSLVTIPNLVPRIAYISEQQPSGTAGGSSIATTWTTRTLNTIVDSTGIVTSLASNQFTLPAGTYSIKATAPAISSTSCRIRIRNITDSTTALVGESTYSAVATSVIVNSTLNGEFTITSSKTYALQYYVGSAQSTTGLGVASSSGEVEVYGQVIIQKIK